MHTIYFKTPFCKLKIIQSGNEISHVDFVNRIGITADANTPLLKKVIKQIQQYLHTPQFIFNLPLNPQGTEFQCRVWLQLQKIPSGEVKTYGEIAAILNSSPPGGG